MICGVQEGRSNGRATARAVFKVTREIMFEECVGLRESLILIEAADLLGLPYVMYCSG